MIFTFSEVTKIDGMRFLQRPSSANGVVTKFDLLVRQSENDEWTLIIDDGVLATDASWQLVSFDAVDAKQVKFQVVDATSGEVGNKFAAAAEVRFTKKVDHEHSYTADVTAPTCTEDGYTTYTCACGKSYIGDKTAALGHNFVNGDCSRCDEVLTSRFEDVKPGLFYFDPVEWAVEKGITTGATATTFNPDGQCSRAEVVTFLWRAAGEPEPTTTENPFDDIQEGAFYYKAVLWANEKNITNGLSADKFGPFVKCNRAQVVTFLWRAQNEPASDAEVSFTDVKDGLFYSTAVAWAVEKGITNGISATEFGVDGICNRAQVVTFLYRSQAE